MALPSPSSASPLQAPADSFHLLPLRFSKLRLPDYPIDPEGEAQEGVFVACSSVHPAIPHNTENLEATISGGLC